MTQSKIEVVEPYPNWASYMLDSIGDRIRRVAEHGRYVVKRVVVGPELGREMGAPCEVEGVEVTISGDLADYRCLMIVEDTHAVC